VDGDEHQDIEGRVPAWREREVAEIRAMLDQLTQAQGLARGVSTYLAGLPAPAGTLPRSHLGAAPGRWMNSFPQMHECVSPPIEPGSVAVCGSCRTQRVRDQLGQVVIYPYERETVRALADERFRAEERWRAAQASGEVTVLGDPPEPLAIEAGPAEGSPGWWAAATRDDLEPGWWGQPDLPELPAGKVCTECRLPWPAPDGSGLCRYCRLARAEQAGAAEAATGPDWGASRRRIEPIPLQPKTITRRRCAPGAHRAVHLRAVTGTFLPVYLVGCALFVGPGSPGFFLFLGLFMALMSYRALRK
jgi:hypothetical protein